MRPALALIALLSSIPAGAENWPEWRGPARNGVSGEKDLPIRWGANENVLWKVPLEGLGTSTPIVWNDVVLLTYQVGVGPLDRRGAEFPEAVAARDYSGGSEVELFVHAVHRDSGQTVWRYRFTAGEPARDLPAVHPKHNFASPSAVTDGEHVYAWMGTGQLVALTMEGELVWERHLGHDFAPFRVLWGHGSSPALYEGSVILLVDHPERAYMVALNKRNGKTKWTVEREDGIRSYSTPFVLRREGREGEDELIVNSSHRIESYDPSNGALLWHVGEPVSLAIGMPVYEDGVLYASRGYSSGPYSAIRLGPLGHRSEVEVLWHVPTRAPYISSLIYYEGLIFMANEGGIATAVDPESGEPVWRERLGGAFTASPVAGDGKVYLMNEAGETFVFEPGTPPTLLAHNEVGERTLASPAISNETLFIRTDEHLFAIKRR